MNQTMRSYENDMLKFVECQVKGISCVLEEVPGQMHSHFPKANSVGTLKYDLLDKRP